MNTQKYMIETPILEGVANREYYGRSATSIENKSTIKYDTEQGVTAFDLWRKRLRFIADTGIAGEYIDTNNEYVLLFS